MRSSDIPVEYQDSIMAGSVEIRQVHNWVEVVFLSDDLATGDLFLARSLPFSFTYAGRHSSEFIGSWQKDVKKTEKEDHIVYEIIWKDPTTRLAVKSLVKAFKHYPAVDWVLYFENMGEGSSPIIEDIRALDISLQAKTSSEAAVLHQIKGDTEDEESFMPFDTDILPSSRLGIAPKRGKSSTDTFPFFNFQLGENGLITAVGWTGQWSASFMRDESGMVAIEAGMEKTHLYLRPGEHIRTPRILIMPWKGDILSAHNRFRRLMLFHYLPQQDGRPVRMPVALQCFDRYSVKVPKWATEEGQIHAAEVTAELGCDTLWLDAAWFPNDFPAGVGNWIAKPDAFPNGLKPVSDAAHKLGLQFLLWFEPERATSESIVAKEHPEFLFPKTTVEFGGTSHLFRLDDPAARKWMTDLLSQRISEWDIDIYRNDFNINPLRFWQENDEPDRQGYTEAKYIEGLYEMWDELLARHPGLVIDNVAGGGRRIDLEMCIRSVPMWRSDTACGINPHDWNQTQSFGINFYVPLHSIAVWNPSVYDCRSTASAGAVCEWDYLDTDFPFGLALESVEEIKTCQKYWYGDYYPLTGCSARFDQIVAWQLHRPDLDGGIVLAFRRKDCQESARDVRLHGLNPENSYRVDVIDDDRNKITLTRTGQELADGLYLQFDRKPGSLLVHYWSL